ncbi:MAG: protein translocase subunit SecF, partial [Parcubacteria group bacterium]
MFIVKHRKIWFALSGVFFAASIWVMFAYGFNLSIDFKGGTITEVRYEDERLDKIELEENITGLGLGGFSVRPSGEGGYVIRTRELTDAEREMLLSALGHPTLPLIVERQNTVGPVAGAELQSKATKAIVVVVLMIVIFITFAFRKVSVGSPRHGGVSSWKYGLATVAALVHDIIIPTGIFVWLGYLNGYEIDLLFVTGLLAILGYSVHDTIVVFDRVRENLSVNNEKNINEEFETTVGKSVNQTFVRSINTSLTLLITIAALYIWGSTATQSLALLLIIGVIAGTYSSIFIA